MALEQQELAGRGHEGAFRGMGTVVSVDLFTYTYKNWNCTLNICTVYCIYAIIQSEFLAIKKRGMMNTGLGRMVPLVRETGREEDVWLNAGYCEVLHFILGWWMHSVYIITLKTN